MKPLTLLISALLVCISITACPALPGPSLSTRSIVSSTLPVELAWTLRLDGKVTQSPLVTEHWAAIVTQKSLYVVDIATGELQWQLPNRTYPDALPMVAISDSLVIGEFGAMVSSLNFETGQLQWQTQVNEEKRAFFNSVIVVDDLIVVASQPTEIKALAPSDGAVQWAISSRTNEMSPRGVVIYAYKNKVYVADLETYVVDALTGKVERVIAFKTTLMQIAGDYLFDQFGAYSVKTFQYQYDFLVPTRKYPFNSCDGLDLPYTLEGNLIIAADSCGGTYAMDLRNGQVEWEYLPKLVAEPPFAIMHDVVYALMDNGEIHAIALNSGRNVGILQTNGALAGNIEGELTSMGLVTNDEVLIAIFNEPTVFGFRLPSN